MPADIVILAGPIWLGDQSSQTRKIIERLYAYSGDVNAAGQWSYYGKVGGSVTTGNEDGGKHVSAQILYALQHIGLTVPPQSDSYWVGEAGPGPSYLDPQEGGRTQRVDDPQHGVHDLEPAAPRADAQGRGRDPGLRQLDARLGPVGARPPEPGVPCGGVIDHRALLEVAIEEARAGMAEGGIPIGAALFDSDGALLGRGHNQRVQRGDPSAHGETEAFRNAGRRRSYRDTVMVTTLSPCWYCSGLVRQFGIGAVIVGESRTFQGGAAWLRECGVEVVDLDSEECVSLLQSFIAAHPEIWDEDIGE